MLRIDSLHTVLDTDHGLVRAVEDLAISIERGETFALVGESGCGKSMTALSILRLLPENGRVAEGSIRVGEVDVVQLPEARMRDVRGRRVSIIFQEPATSLNPVMRVGEQIVEVIERHTAVKGQAARDKAVDWLARVGIPEPARRVDDYPFQLSGGQKQRVMIAVALAAEPDLVIADEPTTALDVTIQKQILDLLRDLQAERGMAMLLITHDLGIVAQMAHQVALMYAGQVVEHASTAEFFARPLHPYAQMLFAALPDTAKRGRPLAAIAGTVPRLDREFAGCRFVDRCPRAFDACRDTPPGLYGPRPGHEVRCLLHRAPSSPAGEGRGAGAPAPGPGTDLLPPSLSPPGRAEQGLPQSSPASGESAGALLDVRDYRVWFPIRKGLLKRTVGYVKAVDGVSFSIAPARSLALVGESGCGKTTIGKGILQLLRGVARIDGSATLGGQRLDALEGERLRRARREMQIIFQDPFASLNPRMRVAEIMEEGVASLRPEISPASRRERVVELLRKVGLHADAVGRYPHEFSGGQRQRIAIARALAVEPNLIICDEPTSALDVSVQAQILNLLAQLQRELGVAYLFITHNFGVVEYLAHDIAVMQAGRIVEAGPAEQILGQPQHEYTRTLLAAVPRLVRAA
jgi:peptide/nickel transport system ATP-binding protein